MRWSRLGPGACVECGDTPPFPPPRVAPWSQMRHWEEGREGGRERGRGREGGREGEREGEDKEGVGEREGEREGGKRWSRRGERERGRGEREGGERGSRRGERGREGGRGERGEREEGHEQPSANINSQAGLPWLLVTRFHIRVALIHAKKQM